LYNHNKLKTDPNKLILTKEVCEEMMLIGCKDMKHCEELLHKIRMERDKEFERNSFIEYHIFMKIIIENLALDPTVNPNQMLQKLFFEIAVPIEEQEVNDDVRDLDRPMPTSNEMFDPQDVIKSSNKNPREENYNSRVDGYNRNFGSNEFTSEKKRKDYKSISKSKSPYVSASKNKPIQPTHRMGGVNDGSGGEFYIGQDESQQSNIELHFRAQFTILIERFIESV